jgi:tetratricopeptide (TPR) repeat protein
MMPVMGAAAGCVSSCPCSSSSSVAAAAAASPMLTISKLPLCSTFLPLQAQQQPSCCGYEWRWRKRRRRRRDWGAGGVCVRAAEPNVVESQTVVPSSAKDAINLGLSLFSKGRVRDALAQFDSALEMRPNAEEAQAALYNKACCHARR